jgi:hypothetical protein
MTTSAIFQAAYALVLHLVIAMVLVRKYIRTRDAGFIWLGAAVVVWPVVSNLLNQGEHLLVDRIIRHQPVSIFPFNLVERGDIAISSTMAALAWGEQIIGVGLLLVAVLFLSANRSRTSVSS